MRTISEITTEINQAKAMASCGKDYKRFIESSYMLELQRELAAAKQGEIDHAYVAACVAVADEAAAKANESFVAADRCRVAANGLYSNFYTIKVWSEKESDLFEERMSMAHKAMCEHLNIEAE